MISSSVTFCLVSALLLRPVAGSQEYIAGYEPITLVVDHAAIDLDQREIEKWLVKRMFEPVEAIYKKGGHSQTIARMKLVNAQPPVEPFPVGTLVYGWADTGDAVEGRLTEEITWTEDDEEVVLSVAYKSDGHSGHFLSCHVGGLVFTDTAKKAGCFASSGMIQVLHYARNVPAYQFHYTYDVEEDNYSGLTIQQFSTLAFGEMWNCTNCPYDTFGKFVKYYGSTDYGDQWVLAALEGTETTFDNGNVDFTQETTTSKRARAESVKITTKFLNVWMYVIRMMEHALDQCELPCKKSDGIMYSETQRGHCDDSPVKAWDQAVAFYAGSLEGETGMGNGLLLFDLADKMCTLFGTCGDNGSLSKGTSEVNDIIIKIFQSAQINIMKRECDIARISKERIEEIMVVPLIQATLFSAYEHHFNIPQTEGDEDPLEFFDISAIQGSTFAGTVLPLVHDCSQHDAKIIYENMRLGRDESIDEMAKELNFRAVKEAFERNYECMGITCSGVGGIMEAGQYAAFASPCKDSSLHKSNANNAGLIAGASIGCLLACLALVIIRRRFQNQTEPAFEDPESTTIPDILQASREFD